MSRIQIFTHTILRTLLALAVGVVSPTTVALAQSRDRYPAQAALQVATELSELPEVLPVIASTMQVPVAPENRQNTSTQLAQTYYMNPLTAEEGQAAAEFEDKLAEQTLTQGGEFRRIHMGVSKTQTIETNEDPHTKEISIDLPAQQIKDAINKIHQLKDYPTKKHQYDAVIAELQALAQSNANQKAKENAKKDKRPGLLQKLISKIPNIPNEVSFKIPYTNRTVTYKKADITSSGARFFVVLGSLTLSFVFSTSLSYPSVAAMVGCTLTVGLLFAGLSGGISLNREWYLNWFNRNGKVSHVLRVLHNRALTAEQKADLQEWVRSAHPLHRDAAAAAVDQLNDILDSIGRGKKLSEAELKEIDEKFVASNWHKIPNAMIKFIATEVIFLGLLVMICSAYGVNYFSQMEKDVLQYIDAIAGSAQTTLAYVGAAILYAIKKLTIATGLATASQGSWDVANSMEIDSKREVYQELESLGVLTPELANALDHELSERSAKLMLAIAFLSNIAVLISVPGGEIATNVSYAATGILTATALAQLKLIQQHSSLKEFTKQSAARIISLIKEKFFTTKAIAQNCASTLTAPAYAYPYEDIQ